MPRQRKISKYENIGLMDAANVLTFIASLIDDQTVRNQIIDVSIALLEAARNEMVV